MIILIKIMKWIAPPSPSTPCFPTPKQQKNEKDIFIKTHCLEKDLIFFFNLEYVGTLGQVDIMLCEGQKEIWSWLGEGWEQKRDNGSRQDIDGTNGRPNGRSPFC